MSPDEIRSSIAYLGWNQLKAAQNLMVPPREFRYWCAGDPRHPVPAVVSLLLRLLVQEKRRSTGNK